VQLLQQQALMAASMVPQCPAPGGNALFNSTAVPAALQGVTATHTAAQHIAPAPAYSTPIITAANSGNEIVRR